jgi:DNA-binding NarL/FixJ family response regulator
MDGAGTWPLRRTRILLADLPRLLREILSDALTAQSDMEVVGSVTGRPSLDRMVEEAQIDVIVIGHDDPGVATALLRQRPPIAVIAVTADAQETGLYQLRPRRVGLPEMSPTRLVETIRQATEPWSGTARSDG